MKPFHRVLLALSGLCAVFLAACGPGVGGTGTGYGSEPGAAGMAWFNAQPQSVCDGALAATLQCTAASPGMSAVPGDQVRLVGPCASATFEADQIVLDLICSGGVFAGSWGRGSDAVGRYYGLFGTDPLRPPTDPATLDVQVEGARVTVWLRDLNGIDVAGPLLLDLAGTAMLPGSE